MPMAMTKVTHCEPSGKSAQPVEVRQQEARVQDADDEQAEIGEAALEVRAQDDDVGQPGGDEQRQRGRRPADPGAAR